MSKRFMEIWGWPIALALLTIFGLFSALLGFGIWYWLSWMALSVPIVMIWHYWLRPRKK
ncbi:DUF4175 domain-containing protein [Methylobacillus arboreus]|uniref:DUF4175 domain-containing protein n=1 Tax=Methylobacillus arboreus TaxID=755170 RepID=UPI001E53C58F|nr:DUF4175 domain-containing protein [Methylobacillus arboreus]MCB5190937.1 DUF4175 domain-containing protein [Methylobacillus arboreus]